MAVKGALLRWRMQSLSGAIPLLQEQLPRVASKHLALPPQCQALEAKAEELSPPPGGWVGRGGDVRAFCLPSLGCRGCSSSQYPWGCEVLKGVLPFSQEVLPGGLGACDPKYWGELAKAWGSEVKRHILQIPDRGWRQLKVPLFQYQL